jgi:hypothetical protein
MPVIKCQNVRYGQKGQQKCNRFLGFVTESQLQSLILVPGSRMILRCPACPNTHRFALIYYTKKQGLTWEVREDPPSFHEEVRFDTVISGEEV